MPTTSRSRAAFWAGVWGVDRLGAMPELPDIIVYAEALHRTCVGVPLTALQVRSPFVLRTAHVSVATLAQKRLERVGRMGKRLVLGFEGGTHVVIHLMIAGRLTWVAEAPKPTARAVLAVFRFETGHLVFTESSTKKRAALWLFASLDETKLLDPGGLSVKTSNFKTFAMRLRQDNHTLKRALTDPRRFDGIGNAFSDEILHAARLSPVRLTQKLTDEEVRALHKAVVQTLETWTQRLRAQTGNAFPKKVTAFRPEMAVHGKYKQACPVCGQPVQRIVYASNETNYCAMCQNGGKLLADRALSRLLKADWPKNLEDWEEFKRDRRG